jgi:hypothetical protein
MKQIFCDLCGRETEHYATYHSVAAPQLHLCLPPKTLHDASIEPRNCVKALQDFLAAPREKEPA